MHSDLFLRLTTGLLDRYRAALGRLGLGSLQIRSMLAGLLSLPKLGASVHRGQWSRVFFQKELAELWSCSLRTVNRYLAAFRKAGILRVCRRGRGGTQVRVAAVEGHFPPRVEASDPGSAAKSRNQDPPEVPQATPPHPVSSPAALPGWGTSDRSVRRAFAQRRWEMERDLAAGKATLSRGWAAWERGCWKGLLATPGDVLDACERADARERAQAQQEREATAKATREAAEEHEERQRLQELEREASLLGDFESWPEARRQPVEAEVERRLQEHPRRLRTGMRRVVLLDVLEEANGWGPVDALEARSGEDPGIDAEAVRAVQGLQCVPNASRHSDASPERSAAPGEPEELSGPAFGTLARQLGARPPPRDRVRSEDERRQLEEEAQRAKDRARARPPDRARGVGELLEQLAPSIS